MGDIVRVLTEQMLDEEFLDEAAVDIGSAIQEGLALCVKKNNTEIYIDLYSPKELEDLVENNDYSDKGLSNIIVATMYVEFKNTLDAWVIGGSAAEKGFGPLLYDITMSAVAPGYLTSDRGSVSSSARKVWNYMLTVRPNDFIIKQISDNRDEPALNYAFAIKNPIDYSRLLTNHVKTVAMLDRIYNVKIPTVLHAIERGGNKYFEIRFKPNS